MDRRSGMRTPHQGRGQHPCQQGIRVARPRFHQPRIPLGSDQVSIMQHPNQTRKNFRGSSCDKNLPQLYIWTRIVLACGQALPPGGWAAGFEVAGPDGSRPGAIPALRACKVCRLKPQLRAAAELNAMKILLAVDDSQFADAAIHALLSQMRRDHVEVLVLHVVDWSNVMPSPFPTVGEEPMYSARQLEAIITAETSRAHELVKKAAEHLGAAGFEVSTSVREGSAKMVILDCAVEWSADLIVVGSHGRKGIARFLLGSVSEAVARHARCSVQIVRLPKQA